MGFCLMVELAWGWGGSVTNGATPSSFVFAGDGPRNGSVTTANLLLAQSDQHWKKQQK